MTDDMPTLIEHARRGDSQAIGRLYELYAPRIFRYVAYRVSTHADAEDLTAEVFVRMVKALPSYRDTGAPFEAWLYRIAGARVVDFRRRQRPQVALHEDAYVGEDDPQGDVEERQEFERLRAALARLSDEQQTVLVLRFIERKSHQEVAAIVGKSETAVKSIQHRALTELAALLGSEKTRHYLRGGGDD